MTEKQAEPTPTASTPVVPSPPTAKKNRSVAGGLALILSLIAISASGFLWYVLAEKQRLLDSDVVSRVGALASELENLRATQTAVTERLTGMKETQDTLRASVEKMSSDFGRTRNEWALAEAEQLLYIANHRLQLAQDVDLALAALRAADRQLKQVANPALLPVRRILANEIGQLESVQQMDVEGLALRLSHLTGAIEQLPVGAAQTFEKQRIAPATEPVRNAWWQFGHEIWQDLVSLVRIRHNAERAIPLLAPEDQFFLRENLRLTLFGAQIALLRNDPATYRQNLQLARTWLTTYFDADSLPVAKAAGEVDTLIDAAKELDMPDISASLHALKKITARQGNE